VETPESPVSSSVDLGVLSLLAFFVVVVVVVVVKTMMGSSVASVFSSSLLLLALLSVVQAEVLFDSNLTTGRNTLSGAAPLIIANGGTSGLYPDQTLFAYQDALNTSSQPLALLCDLQLTKDNLGICRTGLNLTTSTFSYKYNVSSTYVVNGVPTHGYFSVDYMQADLLNPNFTTAVQPNLARSPLFDQYFPLLSPDTVGRVHLSSPTTFWLNVEYPSFFQQHPGKNSLASYLTDLLASPSSPAYLSATEVGILRLIGPTARRSRTSLILKVLDPNTVEQSTNTTYGTLLQNLMEIRTYASGILVPKNLIWPINDKTQYLQAHTNLVEDAHKAKLSVYAYDFANDQYPNSFNYSFDPIAEYLAYVGQADFSVDGVLTDFPSTASEAINCYTTGYQLSLASKGSEKTQQNSNKLVISHNGDSGDFPGCTMLAYTGAINGGSDYIDCPIQITSDGVPICREDANLIKSTDILTNHALWQTYYTSYAGFQNGSSGVFTFDVPWADISTLRARMYSPNAPETSRNTANDNVEGVLTLANFLQFAKSNPGVGIYIDIQVCRINSR
jgi:glycerophosphoryl diester phosphodiesterase